MRRSKAEKVRHKAQIDLAAQEAGEGALTNARAMGVEVGKQVEYVDMTGGCTRFGVVRKLHRRSVEIELSAAGLFKGGEDMVIREDEVPYGHIVRVLGDGRLTQSMLGSNSVKAEAPKREAPKREEGYTKCDFCNGRIYEVIKTTKGLYALCRSHAEVPEEGPAFKYKRLGLIFETFRAWPKPKAENESSSP